ncbi:hypothetical protein [Georgenia sp. SUBG003]|uniref:hypothetical protein n=1 Tax=Georgenia sp. SUBG003 TaxID=1497974 RepID=UPI003AB164BD
MLLRGQQPGDVGRHVLGQQAPEMDGDLAPGAVIGERLAIRGESAADADTESTSGSARGP